MKKATSFLFICALLLLVFFLLRSSEQGAESLVLPLVDEVSLSEVDDLFSSLELVGSLSSSSFSFSSSSFSCSAFSRSEETETLEQDCGGAKMA